jgi:hypothetical protein
MICEACGKSANRPLEWTGLLILSAEPPQAPCLPLRGSVLWLLEPLQQSPKDSHSLLRPIVSVVMEIPTRLSNALVVLHKPLKQPPFLVGEAQACDDHGDRFRVLSHTLQRQQPAKARPCHLFPLRRREAAFALLGLA